MASNVENGRAFEYTCVVAVLDLRRSHELKTELEESDAYHRGREAFDSLPEEQRRKYRQAAAVALQDISGLEPQLVHDRPQEMLIVKVNADNEAQGPRGDVSDVLCVKRDDRGREVWRIGISCKHNHEALRHPRITKDGDFGKAWLGLDRTCSAEFLATVQDILKDLPEKKKDATQAWEDMGEQVKNERYYRPLLLAHCSELERLSAVYPDTPARILSYFFGIGDFYKIIARERRCVTDVIAFNMGGSLNKPAGGARAKARVKMFSMPRRLIEASLKKERDGSDSPNTLICYFDAGWSISMRLHNKDKMAHKTSLAWDVRLLGVPSEVYQRELPWEG